MIATLILRRRWKASYWSPLRRLRPSAILFTLLILFPALALAQSPFDTGFTAMQTLFTGIEAWRRLSKDSSPEALMFPTFGRGERKGQAVPRWGKNFLNWRIRPIARKLGISDRLVTFQVMRRTLGTDMRQHGTLKDTQGMLRHASIKTTGDVYVQTIELSVLAAVNSRTSAVLGNWRMPEESLGLKGRNLKGLNGIRRSSAKSIIKVAVSA